jgi:hypothetical protein
MTKSRKFLGLALILSTLAPVLFAASRTAEPRYRGRPLSGWLQQHWQTSTHGGSTGGQNKVSLQLGSRDLIWVILGLI